MRSLLVPFLERAKKKTPDQRVLFEGGASLRGELTAIGSALDAPTDYKQLVGTHAPHGMRAIRR
jgi:hypothetical protein